MKPFQPIPLSPVDHTLPPSSSFTYLLAFRTSDNERATQCISSGLYELIKRVTFLAGEIVVWPIADGRINVQHIVPRSSPSPEAEVLEIRHHSFPLADIRKYLFASSSEVTVKEPHGSSCIALSALLQNAGPRANGSSPVLQVTTNCFDGGLVLAISFNHCVFDGTGATAVVEMLADCCHAYPGSIRLDTSGERQVELRKLLSKVDNSSPTRDLSHQYGPIESILPSGFTMREQTSLRFTFCHDRIRHLKTLCAMLSGAKKADGADSRCKDHAVGYISTNDILTAVIAICVQRARIGVTSHAMSSSQVVLSMPVNIRDKLGGPFDKEIFLGNMFAYPHLELNLIDHSLLKGLSVFENSKDIDGVELLQAVYVARQVRHRIQQVDEEYAWSMLAYLGDQQCGDQTYMKYFGMALSSWREFPIFEFDFGQWLGGVSDFQLHTTLIDGLAIVMPKRPVEPDQTEAPFEVHLTLEKGVMTRFKSDPLIQWLQG